MVIEAGEWDVILANDPVKNIGTSTQQNPWKRTNPDEHAAIIQAKKILCCTQDTSTSREASVWLHVFQTQPQASYECYFPPFFDSSTMPCSSLNLSNPEWLLLKLVKPFFRDDFLHRIHQFRFGYFSEHILLPALVELLPDVKYFFSECSLRRY